MFEPTIDPSENSLDNAFNKLLNTCLLVGLLLNLFGIVVLICPNICIHNAVILKTRDRSCIVVDRDPMTKIIITSFVIFGQFFLFISLLLAGTLCTFLHKNTKSAMCILDAHTYSAQEYIAAYCYMYNKQTALAVIITIN